METNCYTDESNASISPLEGANPRTPYEHQRLAMEHLDKLNQSPTYSTLLVLPTGGGKTYTASTWLLKNAIDKKKKILWLAHRQMLLDQAAESFHKFAYAENIPHISSFNFRIISGSRRHGRPIDIKPTDDILFISKDSIGRNLNCLDKWLQRESELFLIIDEAHHSIAKTYRKIIDYVKQNISSLKLIGLTATPFRTANNEAGLLAKIYSDGIMDDNAVYGDIGIAYQISLKELINRQILSTPHFDIRYTDEKYGESLGLDAWENIQHLDTLPEDIADQMARSAARNKLIVDAWRKNKEKY